MKNVYFVEFVYFFFDSLFAQVNLGPFVKVTPLGNGSYLTKKRRPILLHSIISAIITIIKIILFSIKHFQPCIYQMEITKIKTIMCVHKQYFKQRGNQNQIQEKVYCSYILKFYW